MSCEHKYRIVTDGQRFKVQLDKDGEWKDVEFFKWGPDDTQIKGLVAERRVSEFAYEQEAEKYARGAWGGSANRVREWRTV